ncbi:MFS transporter [Helicobacter cholecystus]|uniref:MFS transporter n=1 Tax=Helicobacter cholecystus TaxID=45498 RepID=UPI0027397BC7|nr:MFS transporter [Helicobacter cholecystus]
MSLFKSTLPLSLISALRFLGLFLVIPTIAVYVNSLGATPLMIGLAVGGYALTQIIFQTPFGILGDKFDKRAIIAFGLIVFVIGSLICAMSETIYWLVAGRLIQGMGAISSLISALISDLTPEEHRTKAMAIMGGAISISFLLSMLIGPLIGGSFGLNVLFYIAALCSLLSLLILLFKVPKSSKITYSYLSDTHLKHYLKDKNLWMMYMSSFLQKALANLAFVIIPLVLHKDFAISESDLWKFYAPAGIIGILAMAPASIFAEKYGHYKNVMIAGIIAFIFCFVLFFYSDYIQSLWLFVIGIIVFFIGFDIHEPIMQSLASKYPRASQRSSALGLFTTFGFLGSFMGAVLGGVLYNYIGIFWLSLLTGAICCFWIFTLWLGLKNPKRCKTLFLKGIKDLNKASRFNGIEDLYLAGDTLCIKYDPQIINEEAIKEKFK